jgi:hypothetical protein
MKNLPTYDDFINEQYQKYADYRSSRDGDPRVLKADAEVTIARIIPLEFREAKTKIKSIEDQSEDNKGIKFEIRLTSGEVIYAFKIGQFRGEWEWYFNKKKMSDRELREALEDKMLTPFEKWKRHYDMSDKDYAYANDRRSYTTGAAHAKHIETLYDALSSSDKKKADDYKSKN